MWLMISVSSVQNTSLWGVLILQIPACNVELCKLLIILWKHTNIYQSPLPLSLSGRAGPAAFLQWVASCSALRLISYLTAGSSAAHAVMTVKIEDRNKNNIKRKFDDTFTEDDKISKETSPKLKRKKVSQRY